MGYAEFYRQSLDAPDAFWAEQGKLIDWHTQPTQICDNSRPPFTQWFVGGTTNLCHNAVDRHLAARGDQAALIYVSTETAFGHGMVPYTKTDRDTVNIALTEATEEDPEVVGGDPGTPDEPAVEDDSGGGGVSPRGEPVIEELL